ncbi:MAG TPA: ATP-binding protein [Methanocorpusculum sp.]|nr:ATP-binding protein [Methanocorpusculum sp.]HJJ45187.1 ATP-binding protein [Methanocorpusculum sp.]
MIHINLMNEQYESLLEARALYTYIKEHTQEGKNNIVCIDEIQLCENFEKAVSWIHAEETYDIYITGSNAFLSGNDLATLFTGRTYQINIFPFSFAEFMTYYELTDSYQVFDRYILEGGMAGSYLYKDAEQKYRYIREVYRTLIVRDIKTKFGIKNSPLLASLTEFMIDTMGCETSVRNITDKLISEKTRTNNKTIGAYIEHLCNAFLIIKIRRYDIQGKRYLASRDKYYLADHSFRYAALGTKNMNYGRTLENIVAVELLRRGYEVYTGFLSGKEIDFVAVKQSEKIYIQVSDNIENPETFKRECAPLLSVKDAYPKYILARTRGDTTDFEGIHICDISRWILGAE